MHRIASSSATASADPLLDRHATLGISLLWSSGWLLLQFWLLYRQTIDSVSSQLSLQPWWRDASQLWVALKPLLLFALPVLGLHVLFAWANADAFRTLLQPRVARRHRQLLALLAQLLLATLALSLACAWLYPHTIAGDGLFVILHRASNRWLAAALVAATALYFLAWAVLRVLRLGRMEKTALAAASACAIIAPLLHAQLAQPAFAGNRKPDIIIIGIDSLRPDHLRHFGAPFAITPNIDAMLDKSVVFADTLTTQAHTFPATVSILTGQWPTRNGARGNLFPPHTIARQQSVAHRFKAAGYRTVFALDETRFANIDQAYGFDELVGPGIGVQDFLMSLASDFVLVNLAVNAPGGRWLFPHLNGNRAVDPVYSPDAFNTRLAGALPDHEAHPLFLYAHFCSAHWPYREPSRYGTDQFESLRHGSYADARTDYLRGLAVADAQVGQLLADLRKAGRLDNAIVVLLSDHGEDFNMKKDAVLDQVGAAASDTTYGHSSSSFRAPQVRVLLGWRRFGPVGAFPARTVDAPASVVDIAPTLSELAGINSAGAVASPYDGISLASTVRGEAQLGLSDRIRFVESAFILRSLNTANVDPAEVLGETAHMHTLTPAGRVEVREDSIPRQITYRERAAYVNQWVLVKGVDPAAAPFIIDRTRRQWWTLDAAPQDAPRDRLQAALCTHWQADRIATASLCDSK